MSKNRGLYLMRYNTINIKYHLILESKNNFNCIDINITKYHRFGKTGFKFGRTSNIKKRLEYYKNNKEGIQYNLIKFFPCNKEKIREFNLAGMLRCLCDDWFRWESARLEHIPIEYITLKDIYKEIDLYANGKMIEDFRAYGNYRFIK